MLPRYDAVLRRFRRSRRLHDDQWDHERDQR